MHKHHTCVCTHTLRTALCFSSSLSFSLVALCHSPSSSARMSGLPRTSVGATRCARTSGSEGSLRLMANLHVWHMEWHHDKPDGKFTDIWRFGWPTDGRRDGKLQKFSVETSERRCIAHICTLVRTHLPYMDTAITYQVSHTFAWHSVPKWRHAEKSLGDEKGWPSTQPHNLYHHHT